MEIETPGALLAARHELPAVDARSVLEAGLAVDADLEARVLLTVAALVCSPSVHNTQPWSLRFLDASSFEVLADPTRGLPCLDLRRRQLGISLGCALQGLQVGARAAGLRAAVTTYPDGPAGPAFRVVLSPGAPPSSTEVALAAALVARRSYRGLLSATVVPLETVRALVEAARPCSARILDTVPALRLLGRVTAMARWAQEQDPELVAARAAWTRGQPTGSDVVPERSVANLVPRQPADLGEEPPPLAVVLSTVDDGPRAWLDVGRALHRMLLVAWQSGVVGCPVEAAVEVPVARAELARALQIAGHPQIVLRLGIAAEQLPPTTGRRSLALLAR